MDIGWFLRRFDFNISLHLLFYWLVRTFHLRLVADWRSKDVRCWKIDFFFLFLEISLVQFLVFLFLFSFFVADASQRLYIDITAKTKGLRWHDQSFWRTWLVVNCHIAIEYDWGETLDFANVFATEKETLRENLSNSLARLQNFDW